MINLGKYGTLKDKGLIALAKLGGAYAIAIEHFDPETGARLSPEIQAVNRDELLALRTRLEADLEALNQFLTDLDALDPIMAPVSAVNLLTGKAPSGTDHP